MILRITSRFLLLCLLPWCTSVLLQGQNPFKAAHTPQAVSSQYTSGSLRNISSYISHDRISQAPRLHVQSMDFGVKDLEVHRHKHSIWINGTPKYKDEVAIRHKANPPLKYLAGIQSLIPVDNVEEEFIQKTENQDDLHWIHTKFQQVYQGLEIFGGEVILHRNGKEVTHFNGIVYPTPKSLSITPSISVNQGEQLAWEAIQRTKLEAKGPAAKMANLMDRSALIILYDDQSNPHLTWHHTLFPSIHHRWEVFVDAHTGEVLQKYDAVCQMGHHLHDHVHKTSTNIAAHTLPIHKTMPLVDGPAIGSGLDLLGNNREVHCYESGGNYFLLDASRPMFKSVSNQEGEPVGVIWTLDTENMKPGAQGWSGRLVSSGSLNWNNPTAVSAHTNGAVAYEYFRSVFNRNSINGIGGNVMSFINVVDENGEQMDNAFWNETAMFYGNGRTGFTNLAKGLDVAGHEMSHGVIQNTAGLIYLNEPGALNESFADIFGVLIERENWTIGELVVNPQVFTSGALRDLSDPHNGGQSLRDRGYQPRVYSERYTGSEDNEGVHINSGIANWAFYKIANAIGLDVAEQIYYRALTNYLTRSSRFIDMRLGAIQAAADLHGANSTQVQAIRAAFDEVGILDNQQPTNTQEDIEVNNGVEVILYVNSLTDKLSLIFPDGSNNVQDFTEFKPISRPSVTDDGAAVVYVDEDQNIRVIIFDWETTFNTNQLTFDEFYLQVDPEPIWKNVAVSKDGARIAAITAAAKPEIAAYDFGLEEWKVFPLFNPTYTEGITTGEVLRADAMEFDFTGEFLLYDAENQLDRTDGADITFWDVGFLSLFDLSQGTWANGAIFKLFTSLPDNVSVGNPTFTKNSPFIIAFDYLETNEDALGVNTDYFVYGANIETGTTNGIFQGTRLNYPIYSRTDELIMFNGQSDDFLGNSVPTIYAAPIGSDKISFNQQGDFIQFLQDAYWPNWVTIGTRELPTSNRSFQHNQIQAVLSPNPFRNEIDLSIYGEGNEDVFVEVYDALGNQLLTRQYSNHQSTLNVKIDGSTWPNGIYFVQIRQHNRRSIYKAIK